MKKRQVFLAAFAATMLIPAVAWAQYPQITEEAKANYTKMMTEERKRSDEAWAKALPIVQKEAKEGRPYIPWAGRPCDLPQADIPSFPGAEGGGMYSFGGRGGKVITVTNLNDRGPGSFREACETATELGVENLVLWHTEDTRLPERKTLYTAEGRQYFFGNLFVPDDLESIVL